MRQMRQLIAALMTGAMLFCSIAPSYAAESGGKDWKTVYSEGLRAIEENIGSDTGELSAWNVLTLLRSSSEKKEKAFDLFYAAIVKDSAKKKTDKLTSPEMLALSAGGADPSDIGGRDLISTYSNLASVCTAYAATDSVMLSALKYTEKQELAHALKDNLISRKAASPSNAWKLGNVLDIDSTAMVLQSLSLYAEEEEISKVIDGALSWLKSKMNADGHFVNGNEPNANTDAEVILALCSLGIDPAGNEWKTSAGKTPMDGLLAFYTGNGTFGYLNAGFANGLATTQAMEALAATARLKEGRNSYFDLSDVTADKSTYLVFGANGGTGGPVYQKTGSAGSSAVITTEKPSRNGYRFSGWSIDPNSSKAEYASGSQIAPGKDTVLFAVWKLEEGGGGTGGGSGGSGSAPGPSVKKASFTGNEQQPVANGTWRQAANGAWQYETDGFFISCWGYIANPYSTDEQKNAWFYFDENGYMVTGWKWIRGSDGLYRCYYLNPVSNGKLGICQLGGTTPDGYTLDASGAWTVNGVVQTKAEVQSAASVQSSGGTSSGSAAGSGTGSGSSERKTNSGSVSISLTANVKTAEGKSVSFSGSKKVSMEDAEGMSAYDLLEILCDEKNWEVEGSGAYVSAINGLGEFDAGEMSGWMYSVNGKYPNIPAGEYTCKKGDSIRWVYVTKFIDVTDDY